MTLLKHAWLRCMLVSAVLVLTTSCKVAPPVNSSAGGGLLGAPPPVGWNNSPAPTGEKLIEVRGYVLARNDHVPASAI